ncbi:MAG: hypothetical protein HFE90_07700 [Firmicutes bacterium]|nr:hypothetical protein [Bacillota bacterium]
MTRINSNGHTLDESVGYIHSEQEKQEYAIFVVSKDGNTTTEPFTLTISFDFASNLDWTEINDSPYFAQSIDMSGALEIVDTTLNVVNDQDWFLWENNSDFTKLSTSVTQGHKVEVYHAENGSQMVLNNYTESNGVREFDIYDMNYIRVFSDKNEADLSYNKYILSLSPAGGTPVGVSTNMDVTLNGDQGKNSYVTYSSLSKTSRFRYNDILNPEVKVTDVNGNPVAGVTVTMTLVSSFWPESSKNHIQTFTGKTNSKGEVTITARPAETLGTYKVYLTDAIDFLHHVDIDNITFSVDDGGTASFSTQVYRLAYSEYMGS